MALHIHAFGPGTSQDSYSSKITEFALEFAQKSHQGKEELLKGKINFETVSKTGSSFVIKGVGGIGQACHKIRQDLENPNHHLFTQTGSSAAVMTLDMIEVANTAVNTLAALSTYKLTGKVGLAQDIGNITELLTPIALTKLSNLSKVTKVGGLKSFEKATFESKSLTEKYKAINTKRMEILNALDCRKINNLHDLNVYGTQNLKVMEIKKTTGRVDISSESIQNPSILQERIISDWQSVPSRILVDKKIMQADNGSPMQMYKYSDGSYIAVRDQGKSGHFKIEIFDSATNVFEKVTLK